MEYIAQYITWNNNSLSHYPVADIQTSRYPWKLCFHSGNTAGCKDDLSENTQNK